jgi:hypothetical protein
VRRLTAPHPGLRQDWRVAGIRPALQEREMSTRTVAAALVVIVGTAACEARRDRDEAGTRSDADTVVTEREMRDTMIVRTDTTVTKDTVRKQGTKPVDTDTVND